MAAIRRRGGGSGGLVPRCTPWPLPTCLLISFLVFLATAQFSYIMVLLRSSPSRAPGAPPVAVPSSQPPAPALALAAAPGMTADNDPWEGDADADTGSRRLRRRSGDALPSPPPPPPLPPLQVPGQPAPVAAAPVAARRASPPWWQGTPQLPCTPPVDAGAGRPLLAAWRARNVDWHDLVKPTGGGGGGSDADVANKARWRDLVESELAVVSLLQGFAGAAPGAARDASALARSDVAPWHAPEGLWGPLAKYAACDVVRDVCVVHATAHACVVDELCGWCRSRGVCVFRGSPTLPEPATGEPVPVCDAPLLVLAASVPAAGDAGVTAFPMDLGSGMLARDRPLVGGAAVAAACDIYVSRNRHALVAVTGNAKMAYHFYQENAAELLSVFGGGGLRTHIWVAPDSTPEFLNTFHVFSDSCWRWANALAAAAPLRVCYAETPAAPTERATSVVEWDVRTRLPVAGGVPFEYAAMESEAAAVAAGMRLPAARMADIIEEAGVTAVNVAGEVVPAAEHARHVMEAATSGSYQTVMLALLGLVHVHPTRPLVVQVSRRNKRLILNEPELVAATEALGVDVVVASLETMPLYAQLLLFRRATVLSGIHGSSLINAPFMNAGAALLQLLPYKLDSGAAFFQRPAEAAGVEYFEWAATDIAKSRFHTHFLGPDFAGRLPDILKQGSQCCGQAIYFSFWVNSDTWVPEEEYTTVLRRCLNSALNRALAAPAQ